MWQSHVEIEGYSVVYFDCIAELWEVKGKAHVLRRFIRYSRICEARMSPALNGSSVIWRFKHSNTIEIRDEITFEIYVGLPHILYMFKILVFM